MPEAAKERISYQEYLEIERRSDEKHGWYDGELIAMAGGSPLHGMIPQNIGGLLFIAFRGHPCRNYSSDVRIRVPETGLAMYPDLSVVCGPVETHPDDDQAVINPVILVEVLSRGTERDDRTWKLAHYRRLSSVRHILLVHQEQELVEHHRRNPDGSWTLVDHGPGETVRLEDLDAALPVDEVYGAAALARGEPGSEE